MQSLLQMDLMMKQLVKLGCGMQTQEELKQEEVSTEIVLQILQVFLHQDAKHIFLDTTDLIGDI